MKLAKWLLGPLAVLGILAGCATSMTDIKGFNMISIEQEKELGNKFAVEIEKQQQPVNDPEVQRYVDKVGRRLLSGARAVEFDYIFKVVKDDSVNAFAIPGGRVYVHTGLLKAADNETELAGVLAHEINHAVARHGTRQMTQEYGYSLVLSLVLGDNPNMLAQLAGQLFGKAGMMSYSREYENQADFLGVETMYKAGYNPNGLTSFFQKLNAMDGGTQSNVARFFSTHPLTSERIQRVQAEIAKLPPQRYLTDETEFKKIKGRLK
ncbi:M48 family metallopeptidase [Geobacter sulfurreducens]|uniref:M48 family metallopeptidase n=1 Tax=Geobacter sulfurreducens TaxID=35554 RepID=UPI002C2A772E|nr:M48 family metallopeptidase [Geobacter sulfurreducens]HML79448.1 M48 family metallopeptidase [Geobacter sulfurreducens]